MLIQHHEHKEYVLITVTETFSSKETVESANLERDSFINRCHDDNKKVNREPIRVWVDYDILHFGHANTMLPPTSKGIGRHPPAIHSEITRVKGPPVFNKEERFKMVSGQCGRGRCSLSHKH
jgi:hypothetical protein